MLILCAVYTRKSSRDKEGDNRDERRDGGHLLCAG